jgi:hypothetical protein
MRRQVVCKGQLCCLHVHRWICVYCVSNEFVIICHVACVKSMLCKCLKA